jgi:hypothetical protein
MPFEIQKKASVGNFEPQGFQSYQRLLIYFILILPMD